MPHVFYRSFRHALRGLRSVWREERNFRIQSVAAVLVLLTVTLLRLPVRDIALLFFAMLLVLGAEILNTFAEDLLNTLHPARDPAVGKLKDMMAGLVLLQSLGALAIGLFVLLAHIGG